MLAEEKKLNWLGIDMRTRWRRRVAVVLTYAAFLAAVWSPSWRAYGVVLAVFYISLCLPVMEQTADLGSGMRWTVRVVFFGLIVGLAYMAWDTSLRPQMVQLGRSPHIKFLTTGSFALGLLLSNSVLGWNRLVDNGDRGWMAKAIRKGDEARNWEKRRLARHGYAMGLEGFARYEYGTSFGALTETQKLEIEGMHRANPRGKWMRQRAEVLFDDERLRNEEAQLRARAQKVTNWVLVGLAYVFSIVLADGETVSASVVVSSLWTLAAVVTTLRQAIPLWIEEDPRRMLGEMKLVEQAQA